MATDLDGDGRMDAALAVHLSGLLALRQVAPGEFVDASAGLPWGRPGSGFSSRSLAAADRNGDGRPDLVALGEGIDPLRGSRRPRGPGPRGVPEPPTGWIPLAPPHVGRSFGDGLAVADVDGDGRPDAVTSAGGTSGANSFT